MKGEGAINPLFCSKLLRWAILRPSNLSLGKAISSTVRANIQSCKATNYISEFFDAPNIIKVLGKKIGVLASLAFRNFSSTQSQPSYLPRQFFETVWQKFS
jgi:hypothetical protein